ncbi:hypothetical protein GCM10020255_019720 [Rhodococcus baikonurensis]
MLRGRTAATGPGDDVALAKSIRRPLNEPKNIAFINEGGGTGKTTTAVLLGLLLASLRNGPIVAVDASPGCGDLGNRVPESKRPAETYVASSKAPGGSGHSMICEPT